MKLVEIYMIFGDFEGGSGSMAGVTPIACVASLS
jgi:hypothetical protein